MNEPNSHHNDSIDSEDMAEFQARERIIRLRAANRLRGIPPEDQFETCKSKKFRLIKSVNKYKECFK